jgi:hypothetical protein
VSAETFNFVSLAFVLINSSNNLPSKSVVIFGAISIFAFLSWYFTHEDKWLRKDQILKALETVDHAEDE